MATNTDKKSKKKTVLGDVNTPLNVDEDLLNNTSIVIRFQGKPAMQIDVKILEDAIVELGESADWAQFVFEVVKERMGEKIKPMTWLN